MSPLPGWLLCSAAPFQSTISFLGFLLSAASMCVTTYSCAFGIPRHSRCSNPELILNPPLLLAFCCQQILSTSPYIRAASQPIFCPGHCPLRQVSSLAEEGNPQDLSIAQPSSLSALFLHYPPPHDFHLSCLFNWLYLFSFFSTSFPQPTLCFCIFPQRLPLLPGYRFFTPTSLFSSHRSLSDRDLLPFLFATLSPPSVAPLTVEV